MNHIATDIIEHFYPGIFEVIVGDQIGLKKKPHPDMVNQVKSVFGIPDEEITYIGDTNVDYETAKNAHIDILLVTYGFRTKEEMEQYHYDCPKVDSPDEIFEFFGQKNNSN